MPSAHSPPFSHALIAALCVMVVFLSTHPCTIAPRSSSALAHLPPCSHALIAALYVIVFLSALHLGRARNINVLQYFMAIKCGKNAKKCAARPSAGQLSGGRAR